MKGRCLALISAALSVFEFTLAHTGMQNALARSHGKVWHASALLEKFFILRQLLENLSLPQRKLHGLVLVVERYDKILDLKCISMRPREGWITLTIPHRPIAVRLVPFPWLCAILRGVAVLQIRSCSSNRRIFKVPQCPSFSHDPLPSLLRAMPAAFPQPYHRSECSERVVHHWQDVQQAHIRRLGHASAKSIPVYRLPPHTRLQRNRRL